MVSIGDDLLFSLHQANPSPLGNRLRTDHPKWAGRNHPLLNTSVIDSNGQRRAKVVHVDELRSG
jgi:hypothetical protein